MVWKNKQKKVLLRLYGQLVMTKKKKSIFKIHIIVGVLSNVCPAFAQMLLTLVLQPLDLENCSTDQSLC